MMRHSLIPARHRRSLAAVAAAGLLMLPLGAPPAGAAPPGAPSAATAAEIVLTPADVGPDFVVVSTAESVRYGQSVRVQTLRRGGTHGHFVEPDGFFVVRSFAMVTANPSEADRAFDEVAKRLGESDQEVPIAAIGERSRGGVLWGTEPFDLASKSALFRVGSTVGWVTIAGYEAPTSMDDVLPLAQIMAERAAR